MKDAFAAEVAAQGDDARIAEILREVCRITQMGFAAVARVTEDRWIACQIEDKIEFGLKPGDELDIKKTICDEIRECGKAIVIDDVRGDPEWRTHPVPIIYGFESYASFPIFLEDGSFFGTLCAIDPNARMLSAPETVAALKGFAAELATILNAGKKQPTTE
jgi:GAF domain-containing protein